MNFRLPNINTKTLFFAIAILVLLCMIVMSRTAGISGDEYFHVDHSVKVENYYKTFGEDTTALYDSKGLLHFYGQSLDTEVHIFNTIFNIEDIYQSRHTANAMVGWILIVFAGLAASLIFGWRAGILTLLFLFFSPKLLGHSWNNLKDIPFASSYIFSLYFILLFLKKLPKLHFPSLLFMTLGIAWSISLRIGGLILIPYLFMFFGLYHISKKEFYTKTYFLNTLKISTLLIGVGVLSYFLGQLLWPYALQNPISNPITALTNMTNYQISLNQLFDGKIQLSRELSWHYGLKYILISSPIVVFIGFFAFLTTLPFRKDIQNNYLFYSFLLFAFAFPIAYTIYKHSNLYGGWRHLLWTFSPFVILAAGGFDFFLNKSNKFFRYGTVALIAILLFHPIKHTFKNHPHQYIYYNQLVGGIKGAYGNYEMDYYYHSLKDGADWLIENKIGEDTIIVATNHRRITEHYFRNYPQVKIKYCRYYEKSKNDWDYAIWANTHISPIQLEEDHWPPKNSVYTMNVDGMPVGAVVKRISYEDLKGFDALNQNKRTEAKEHFKNFLLVYPENEEVLEGYARVMLLERKLDSTVTYADSSLAYNPRQIGALLVKASALNTQKKYTEALEASNLTLKIKDDLAEGHFQKGYALKKLNKPNEALKEFQLAVAHKKEYYQAYIQLGEILLNYKQYKKALDFYNRIFTFKENDLNATVYIAKCYHLLNNNQKAEEILQALPAKNQNNFEAVKVKSRIAMAKNDLPAAGRLINMARNISNNADLFVIRAMYVLQQNKKEDAILFLNKAAELDATNQEAKKLLKSLQAKTTKPAQKPTTLPKAEQGQQQSIMFQKPKPQKTSPVKVPTK